MKWAYGVTTIPQRRHDLLPRTLTALVLGGFPAPRLFVDGISGPNSDWTCFNLEMTCRYPGIKGTYGAWCLSLAELYIRDPFADRYAVFQDDFVCYRNLRQYLEAVPYPTQGYCNLLTFPENQRLVPPGGPVGWFLTNQCGKGAVALVFSREAVTTLLCHKHMVMRPQSANQLRAIKAVDGAIVEAYRGAGWKEYCHNPSLVQHTGLVSAVGNSRHPLAPSFRGEDFDAMSLLPEANTMLKVPDGLRPFIGSWRLMSGNQISSYLTIHPDGTSLRHHVPGMPGLVDVADGEARLTYSDGHQDLLRPNHDGIFIFLGLGRVTEHTGNGKEWGINEWQRPPTLQLRAVRMSS